MSDYVSREQVIDVLKETGIIQDNDLGNLVVDEINRIPTVDETEIIRKAFERIVERLEERYKDIPIQYETSYEEGLGDGIDYAINVAKGGGANDE